MKILIQAGHAGRTSGSTGAPSEREWNIATAKKLKELLKDRVDVTTIDADHWTKEVKQDYDLFLAIHYDADIYNDRGGFVDYPEPSTDGATKESQRMAKVIGDYYFKNTGIPHKKNRSNANTRYYYMWSKVSYSTPCVMLECGVGWRKPEDYTVLRKDSTIRILANAILLALGLDELDNMPKFDVNDDISGDVEKSFDPELKSYEWYDNHWSWQRLVAYTDDQYQSVKAMGESIETLTKENTLLRKRNAEMASTVSERDKMITTLTNERNALKNDLEGIKGQLLTCESEKEALEQKLESCGKKLCQYSRWRRFRSIFVC